MELAFRVSHPNHEIACKLSYLIVNWSMNHIRVKDHSLCRFLEVRAHEKKKDLSSSLALISSAFFKGRFEIYGFRQDR